MSKPSPEQWQACMDWALRWFYDHPSPRPLTSEEIWEAYVRRSD